MNCSECPNQFKCHNESTKMMGFMSEIEKGQNNAFSAIAFDGAEKLRRAVDERHKRIMTGGEFTER